MSTSSSDSIYTDSYTNGNSKIGALFASPIDIISWNNFGTYVADLSLNEDPTARANAQIFTLTVDENLVVNGDTTLNGTLNSISSTELQTLDGIETNIQDQLNLKEGNIDANNPVSASFIGDGSVSNAEYGHLATVSSNIQDQLDAKQPEITSSARLDLTLCGAGNVNNQDFSKLTEASDLTYTIKDILTTPSTKLIQAGTGLSYNTSTTPPTLNASTTITAGTNLTFDGNKLNSTSDARYNSRNSQFFPTIGTATVTKAAFDGAIMARAIIHYGQGGAGPSAIVFGKKNVNSDNEISLITDGKVRFFTDQHGTSFIGGSNEDVSGQTDDNNVYCLNIFNNLINTNANGLYVMAARNRRVLRMDYQNNDGDFRSLEIKTPNDGANDTDDFILLSNNKFRCKINGYNTFRCDTEAGEFIVYNLNSDSDDRIKSNEKPITNALESIMKLKPYTYDKYDNMEKTGASYLESGLISQDVWYNAPELRHLVSLGKCYEADETGKKVNINLIPIDVSDNETLEDADYNNLGWSNQNPSSVKYLGLIAYLIKAVQELNIQRQQEKDALQASHDDLQSSHDSLKDELTQLKSLLQSKGIIDPEP